VTTLSTHVLDVELGKPAVGISVALFHGDERLAETKTNADGRIPDLVGHSLDGGTYRLVFDVAAYFADRERTPAFLRRVSIEFDLNGSDPHYHVPLLLTPYACTSYRGS
jgi:5-hydroxyisourate hydrolase